MTLESIWNVSFFSSTPQISILIQKLILLTVPHYIKEFLFMMKRDYYEVLGLSQ
jgi:hypothetical protein